MAVVETVHFGISVSIARITVGVRSPEAAIQISSSIMGEMITRCFTVNMGYTQMLHSLPAWTPEISRNIYMFPPPPLILAPEVHGHFGIK